MVAPQLQRLTTRTAHRPAGYALGTMWLDDLEDLARRSKVRRTKVLEAAIRVLVGRAHTIPGLDVHQIRESAAGGAPYVRRADGSIGWRASLQSRAPAARRLMWWSRPDGTVELARVATLPESSGFPSQPRTPRRPRSRTRRDGAGATSGLTSTLRAVIDASDHTPTAEPPGAGTSGPGGPRQTPVMAFRVLRRPRATTVAPDPTPAEPGPVSEPTVAPVADLSPARDPLELLATYGRTLRGLSPAPTEGTVMVCGLGPAPVQVAVAAAAVNDAYQQLETNPNDPAAHAAAHAAHRRYSYLTADPNRRP